MKDSMKFMSVSQALQSDYFTYIQRSHFEEGRLPKDYPYSNTQDLGKIGIHYCQDDEEYWIIGLSELSPSFYTYDDALDYLLKKLKIIQEKSIKESILI